MARDIKFNIKLNVDGKEQLVTVTTDIRAMREAMGEATSASTQLAGALFKINQVGQVFQTAMGGLSQLTGVLKGYSQANAVQVEAETKLEAVMRNTMGARADEVQSIKDLCSAQQELGVIGDEVQLSGAQELATYLEKKSSLETLIPVMNDMLAQQYGLNATQESAAQIGTMLGKVMAGQTSALSRYGYTFTEAQEQILKFGTEEQRAATLADVVAQSVGGVNAALAQTDAGRAKQAANYYGDLKEQVGAAYQAIEPAVVAAAELGIAVTSVGTAVSGIAGMVKALGALKLATVGATVATYAHTAAQKIGAGAMALWANQRRFANRMQIAWTFGAKGFVVASVAMRAAIMGLMAVTGVGLAIAAVGGVISMFTGKLDAESKAADEAAKAVKGLDDAHDEASRTLAQTKAGLEINLARLKDYKGSKTEEKKLVKELNDTYGETMGYFATAAQWYEALTRNSAAYCKQVVAEAKARMLANQIAEKELAADKLSKDIAADEAAVAADGKAYDARVIGIQFRKQDLAVINQDVANLRAELDAVNKESSSIKMSVVGASARPDEGGGASSAKEKTRLQEIAAAIEAKKQAYVGADAATQLAIRNEIAALNAEADAIKAAHAEAEAPLTLDSSAQIERAIAAIEAQRKTASGARIKELDEELAKLTAAKKAMEEGVYVLHELDAIHTYADIAADVAYLNAELDKAGEAERAVLREQLAAREQLRRAMDDEQDAAWLADVRAGRAKITTIGEMEEAVSRLGAMQSRMSAAEAVEAQRIINAWQRQVDARQALLSLPAMQDEVAGLNGLEGAALKVRLEAVGIDGIKSKIAELQAMLDDESNPIDPSQRADIEALIAAYSRYGKMAKKSTANVGKMWDATKSVGSSVSGITSALQGNSSAWEKTTAVVDGAIGLYQGVAQIMQIVTAVTQALGLAKQTEAVMTEGASAATAAGSAITVAANTAETVSATEATTANVAKASSEVMAAHASIPWVGVAIGAGMVAAMVGLMLGLPKFADGGIAYGPTLGLFGEYAGAANNPEVVAPLDKLRSLIEPAGNGLGKVEFEIDGRKLRGVLRKVESLSYRS